MNNSNDYGHLRVRSNIVRLRGSQILSRVYLVYSIIASVWRVEGHLWTSRVTISAPARPRPSINHDRTKTRHKRPG